MSRQASVLFLSGVALALTMVCVHQATRGTSPLQAVSNTQAAQAEHPANDPAPTAQSETSDQRQVRTPTRTPGRILAYVRGRDLTVTIFSSNRFDVARNSGQLLAENLNVVEFQNRYPALYESYRTSYAEAWAGEPLIESPIAR